MNESYTDTNQYHAIEPADESVPADPQLLCPQDDVPTEVTVEPAPQPKRGRLWPPILILCLLLVFGVALFFLIDLPSGSVTDPAAPWFTVQDGTLCFDSSKYTGGNELTVPVSIGKQKITAISENCFGGCDRFVMVHLPEGIESLGAGAFSGCRKLRGLQLPETVKTVGSGAFAGCTALEAVCIPYSVTAVGSQPFSGCDKLSHIFYAGPMAAWEALYVELPDQNIGVYCYDGDYPQD